MNQGMVKQNFLERFELLFWNLAIRVLSGSRTTRSVLTPLLKPFSRSNARSMAVLFALCGVAGLVSGYLFFIITH